MSGTAKTTTNYLQTQFFQACRGVFEGGGCRGAAHVGAYEAAIQCGVNFSEVAGTSAGSIIAAFVGASATAEYLVKNAAHLQFASLLSEPKGRISTPFFARMCGPLLRGEKRFLGKILQKGSAHSSEKIQDWVDDRLAELLPHAARPIKFKDLILPTWIVATDLSGRRAKVWSSQHTPDEHVAMAVRCSCSIPLFFEPVEAGNDLYVDGGMLSNLPSFVFAESRNDPLSLGGRILAFRLVGATTHRTQWTIGWLVNRLIDSAISGATVIQRSLMSNVSTVDIPTGAISSTNFAMSSTDVESLLEAGRFAVRKFISTEHTKIDDALSGDVARYGEDELFDDLAREMVMPGKRLLVACNNTRWFWTLFPSVAHWAFAGAAIDVVISKGPVNARERHRRQLLEQLGVHIEEVDALPLTCFILCRVDDRHNSAFALNISQTKFSPTGTVYVGTQHRPIIETMTRLLDQSIRKPARETVQLSLRQGNPQRLIELLTHGVHQYSNPTVSVELQDIELKASEPRVRILVRRIRSFKYRQIANFVALHRQFDVPFGMPADILANGRYVSTITPPVLEQWGTDLIAVEGNTRIFYLHRYGAASFYGLVVKGVAQPLPGEPTDVRTALLSTFELSPKERISQFKYENFRSIEGAVRPEA